ncbi:hypothetical protein A0O28_0042050 [Trichoderma guizhouense]|uniref:BRCT domain-containing protein n=1 Tax=Trichoderma guizhouense TaxID=1491466 RepID=A0A1T3C844_9HYPO|nr:hypothetical protein A0O28_0042050 [Trichoderma guizhouense]
MTRSRPLTRVEQLALEENPESQDSQAILDALNAEFRAATYHEPLALQPQAGIESDSVAGGVENDDAEAETGDLVISSSRQALARQDGPKKQRHLTPHGSVATPHGDVNNLTGTGTIHRVGREDPRTHQPTSRPGSREQDLDDAVIAASSPFGRNAHSPSPPHNHDTSNQSDEPPAVPIGAGRPQAKRMDTSQQTPTQLNVERDYGQFYGPPRSSPPPDTLRSHDERERTLQADDTGAVNFGNLSPGVRPSSQVSEDAGFENTRGEWRVPDLTSQQRSSHGYTPLKPGPLLPETPMPPKNPFAVQQNANAGVPFAGTQLFEQTPVVTSAIKLHSPTSSRPSPNILPDAISLNIIETSPLRNRDNVSSPTVVHTSSPSRPNNITTNTKKLRVSPIQEEALDCDQDAQDDMIPESPTAQPLRPYGNRQPQAHYEPMKKSQERKAVVEVPQAIDSDSDDASKRARHKKRMEKIRRQAAEEMERVRVQIPSRRDLSESRNRKRRKLSSGGEEEVLSTKNASSGQAELANTGNELHSSRKASSLPEQSLSAGSTKATPRDAIVGDGGKRVTAIRPGKSKEAPSEEMIPATSPVRSLSAGAQRDPPVASEPELPPLIENEVREKEAQNELHTSSLPPPRRHAQRIYGRQAQSRRRQRIVTSSEPNERASAEPDPEAEKGAKIPSDAPAIPTRSAVTRRLAKQGELLQTSNTESEPPKSSPPSLRSAATVATSLRNQMRERSPLTPVHRRAVDRGVHTSSSLTALSTPVISEKNTPDTQASPVFDQPESTDSVPSPAQGRKTRARNPGRESSEKTPQQAAKPVKTSMRSARVEPSSTDELQQSPSSSAVELGISSLRSSRVFKQSIGSTFRGRRLFEGMVFAISMSPDKGNQKTRANLETKIKQAGGLILETGFEDHSRKVKYMQALALGLPCLAYQWVMTCLNKGALIDWEPYLLAAGSSAVLGNAVRSRCLRRYDAGDARLVEMVEQRPQLLAGEKLLAIVDESRTRNEGKKKKGDAEKKPYMFLAQALGPSISWVSTIQQARELLEAHDKAGKPYTWLYMDESLGTVESVLTISEPTGKKRRRSHGPLATRNVRVLCDELMIQSLILGRMAEEDEMEYAGEKN